jgi:Ca2+-binding RTX toxin-like protein
MPAGGGPATNITNTAGPIAEHNLDFESVQRCGKRRATIVGDDGPDKIKGTKKKDVIDGNGGKETIRGRGGNDILCGLGKKTRVICGGGNDKVIGKFKSAKGCERGKGL